MLKDILYHSYQRAVEIGKARNIQIGDYEDTFIVSAPDVSRTDNESLARASRDLVTAFQALSAQLPGRSPSLTRLMLKLFSRYVGEPMTDGAMEEILSEAEKNKDQHDKDQHKEHEENPKNPKENGGEEKK